MRTKEEHAQKKRENEEFVNLSQFTTLHVFAITHGYNNT